MYFSYVCSTGHTSTPKLNLCPRCYQKCSIMFNLIISNVLCQIVRCQIVQLPIFRLPNCPFLTLGAKLSTFNSWCQIVWCQIVLNYTVPNCSTINKGIKWVKVLNAVGPLCLWQSFLFLKVITKLKHLKRRVQKKSRLRRTLWTSGTGGVDCRCVGPSCPRV